MVSDCDWRERSKHTQWLKSVPLAYGIDVGYCPGKDAWDEALNKSGWNTEQAKDPYAEDDSKSASVSVFHMRGTAEHEDFLFMLVVVSEDIRKRLRYGCPDAIVALAHESLHVVQQVVHRLGELGEEGEAYLLESVLFGLIAGIVVTEPGKRARDLSQEISGNNRVPRRYLVEKCPLRIPWEGLDRNEIAS